MSKQLGETNLPKYTSVRKEYELLLTIIRSPKSVDKNIKESITLALKTQSSLAAFEHIDSNIVGMSLNTHKAIADNVIEGGYMAFNQCRKLAFQKLKKIEQMNELPNRGTIDWYKNELAEKNKKIAQIANDIAFMSQRLDEVMALAQQMAISAGLLDQFQKQQAELLRKFYRIDSEIL